MVRTGHRREATASPRSTRWVAADERIGSQQALPRLARWSPPAAPRMTAPDNRHAETAAPRCDGRRGGRAASPEPRVSRQSPGPGRYSSRPWAAHGRLLGPKPPEKDKLGVVWVEIVDDSRWFEPGTGEKRPHRRVRLVGGREELRRGARRRDVLKKCPPDALPPEGRLDHEQRHEAVTVERVLKNHETEWYATLLGQPTLTGLKGSLEELPV
jgi:hypothetical protein